MNKYLSLAKHLIELELESIHNDAEFYFNFNDWTEKFGVNSYLLSDKLVSDYTYAINDIFILGKEIEEDFKNKVWEEDKNGLYNYEMPTYYSGRINNIIEIQLADLTKVGTQLELL